MENYLNKKLPINMKNQLWIDFFDCLQEEFSLIKTEIEKKKFLYDVDNMNYERMLEIVNLFKIPFNVSIDNRESFLREEIKSLSFRLKNKATLKIFRSFIKRMERRGDVYIYFFDGEKLTKSTYPMLKNSNSIQPRQVYYVESNINSTGFIEKQIKLDEGRKLDEDDVWKTDNALVKKVTKHLALEIFLDELFFSGLDGSAPNAGGYPSIGLSPSKTLAPSLNLTPMPKIAYLIAKEYFEYIETNANAFRKVSDVVRVGCQLNAFADNSKFFNSLTNLDFTIPSLRLNGVVTDFFNQITSVEDIKFIEFGCGYNKSLPSYDGSGFQPTQLIDPVFKAEILKKEENNDWYAVSFDYQALNINNFIVDVPEVNKSNFTGYLPKIPIKPNNVTITFFNNSIEHTIKDDGFGKLVSDFANGTIDYNTGYFNFNTIIDKETKIFFEQVETVFDYQIDFLLRPILTSTLFIKYVINGTTYIATSNFDGEISGISCIGTVDYTNGIIHLEFDIDVENVELIFKTRKTIYPTIGKEIETSFFTNKKDFYIQEVGLRNKDGDLIAYSCFPRIGFHSFRNYLSFSFFIKKSNF